MPNYLTKRFVPILDEHELKDDDGNTIVKVDEARLKEIARKNNERARQTGDWTPFVIGHTRDETPEEEQPQIVAYAHNFTVRPFGKTGRKALCVDMKYEASKRNLINKYPRRSVELWLDDWKIDPISLLGATTPERDLGLLQLSRGGRKFLRRMIPYSRDAMPFPPTAPQTPAPANQGGGNPQTAEIAQAVVGLLQETEEWQFLKQQIDEQAAEPPMPDPGMGMDPNDPMGGQPPMPPVAPEQDLDDEYGEEDEEEYEDEEDEEEYEDEEDEEDPKRYSAPSGTNTFPPSGPKRKMSRPTRYAAQDLAHRLRAAADQRRLQYARQERAVQYMAQELQTMRLRYQRAEREKDLIQLESEGVLLDRVEELDAVMGLPEKSYQSHLGRLRKRYSRAPVGPLHFSASDMRASGHSRQRDRDSAMTIVEHAQKRGISYETALKEMEGQ